MEPSLKRYAYKGALFGLGLAGAIAVAWASTFNLFQPANGILVGNPNTYVTTAATFSNVAGLWTGTGCGTSTNIPQLNGNCTSAGSPPGGSTTQVQFNLSGAFAGDPGLTFVGGTTTTLTVGNGTNIPSIVAAASAITNAVAFNITGAQGTSTGRGGTFNLTGGTGGSTSGNGGNSNVIGGSAASTSTVTSGNGGSASLLAGRGPLSTATGSISLTGAGGSVAIQGGLGAGCSVCSSNPTGDGGAITITGGTPDFNNAGLGNGGSITIAAGQAFGASPTKTGGNVTITAGSGNGTDTPGNVTISAGTTATIGQVTVHAGQAQLFLQQNGSPEWTLGNNSVTGNRFTGTSAGGVQLGSPTGGDCGSGCLNAQALRINNVPVSTGGTPGGANTDIQFNNSGAFGGASNITYSSSTGDLTIAAPTSGVAFQATGFANSVVELLTGSSTSGQSFGELINAGTTSADYALKVTGQSGVPTFMQLTGDGSGSLGPANAMTWTSSGNFVISAPASGSPLTVNATNTTGFNINGNGSSSNAETITASSSASHSFGLAILAGTNASDHALQVLNQAGSVTFLQINGNGSGTLGPSSTTGLSWNTSGQMTITSSVSPLNLSMSGAGTSYAVNATATGSATQGGIILSLPVTSPGVLAAITQTGTGGVSWSINMNASSSDLLIEGGGFTSGVVVFHNNGTVQVGATTAGGNVVSGLPTCNSTNKGATTWVTDASGPTYNATVSGGGAVVIPVFCNGSNWTAH